MKSAFIALCLILAGCDQLGHESQPKATPDHFQLAVDSNGNAWVLDTRTGEAKRCWQGTAGSFPPICYTAIQKQQSMGTVYILGAGFSKTCGIATDLEMLDALNFLLKPTPQPKDPGNSKTTIEYLREQNFHSQPNAGFELFMSTLSSLKFSSEYLESGRNIFREEEQELRKALRTYLKSCVTNVRWEHEGMAILNFARQVDWEKDYILTFNYDLLLEAAAKRLDLDVAERIIHLHGAISERTLAWPTYTKFAYRTTKMPLAPRWKRAFKILRNQAENQGRIDKLVFIGYSMPPTDLEAKSLFNYTDWYNQKIYSYQIFVINPCEKIKQNYGFFRKDTVFHLLTLDEWLTHTK